MNKNQHISQILAGILSLLLLYPTLIIAEEGPGFSGLTLVQIYNTENLKKIAVEKGETAYKKHCTECHGEEGTGKTGIPDLTNGLWIWGGSLSDLEISIRYGIRSGHALQRYSEMPAYTNQDYLSEAQINDLVEYVLSIAGKEADKDAVKRAENDFEDICAECHNYSGTGRMEYYGAPDLTDYYWLYGENKEAIFTSIAKGRIGVSPAFEDVLDDDAIKMITIYVHYLSHF